MSHRSQIALGQRRILAEKINKELTQRPVSQDDIEDIRMVLMAMCDQSQYSLPVPLRNALLIAEIAHGRTLLPAEVELFLQLLSSTSPPCDNNVSKMMVMTRSGQSVCECRSSTCSECVAPAFKPLEPWYRYPMMGAPTKQ